MSTLERMRSTQVTPKTAAIAIGALLVLCGIAIFGVRALVSGSSEPTTSSQPSALPRSPMVANVDVKEGAATPDTKKQDPKPAAPAVDDPVKSIANRNMFQAVSADASDTSGSTDNAPGFGRRSRRGNLPPMALGELPVLPSIAGLDMALMPRGGQGAASLAYTGLVEIPNGRLALIENTATAETKYVGVGDSAFGMTVTDVSPRSVSLDGGGQQVRLAIGENKSQNPAGAASAQRPVAGQQPQPGQPGQMALPGQTPQDLQGLQPAALPASTGSMGGGNGGYGGRYGGRRRSRSSSGSSQSGGRQQPAQGQ